MGKGKPKDFKIILFNGQIYSAGSAIEGKVFLELSKAMVPVKSIVITLSGQAVVKWSERNGQGSQTFKSSECICGLTSTLWRNAAEGRHSSGLSAGQHEFPFKIQIPVDLPVLASFESHIGSIRYSLIAGISRSKETKLDHTIAGGISMNAYVDTNVPHLMQPLSTFHQQMLRTFWSTCGPVSLSVMIDRSGYCPGENIVFNVTTENRSTQQIAAIRVSLVQEIKYFGKIHVLMIRREKYNNITRVIQQVEGTGIAAGQTGRWNNALLLVPATQPTTYGQHIICMSYRVMVTLVFHQSRNFDFSLQLPITIGTIPLFRQHTQQLRS